MGKLERITSFVLRKSEDFFDFERPASRSEELAFGAFELFVVCVLGATTWSWALDIWSVHEFAFGQLLAKFGAPLAGRGVAFVNAGLVSALLALGWFRRFDRFAYLLALPLIHLQFVARYWPEDGLHHSHLVGMCLLGIGLAFLLFESSSLRIRFAQGAAYVFVALCYTLSALSKLRTSGVDWIDGGNLQMWISMNQVHRISKGQSFELNAVQEWIMSGHGWIGTLILAPGLLVELLGFLMCVPRLRMYYASAVLMMHLGIALVLKIIFPWNISLLILLGYPWPAVIERVVQRFGSLRAPLEGTRERS